MGYLKYLLIIIIPLLLIFTNFKYLTSTYNSYVSIQKSVGVYKNPETAEKQEIATKDIFKYLMGKKNLNPEIFSKQAILHMKDVRELFRIVNVYWYSLLGLFLLIAVFSFKKQKAKTFFKFTFIGSFLAAAVIAISILISIKYFDFVFIKFHLLMFSNSYWLFPPDDLLVEIFPEKFFSLFAERLAQNILICSIVIGALSFFAFRKAKDK